MILVTDKDQAEYTIGEAAEILQVSTRTLRHWDDIELLTPSWRTWGEHRLYSEQDVSAARISSSSPAPGGRWKPSQGLSIPPLPPAPPSYLLSASCPWQKS